MSSSNPGRSPIPWRSLLRPAHWRQRTLSPALRVWTFSACLAALAVILYALTIRDDPPLAVPFHIPWWLVALGFALADIKVIEVHFRRESHAFSLTEVPAVIGLFYLGPIEYLAATSLGALAALLISSRQAPVKLAFNLANYLLVAVVMIAVFRGIQHATGAPGLVEYAAGFAATTVAAVVGAVSIATAITLSGGAPQFKKLPDMLQFGALVAVANTSIALLAVTILWFSPTAIWLLVIPIIALFLAYGAWVSEREKHERLELIYQSSRILQHSPELDVALVALLDHARSMFRAELAEIVLQSDGDEHRAVRTTSLQDGRSETIVPIREMEVHPSLTPLLNERRAGIVALPRTPGGSAVPIRQAMVAPLVGEAGVIGLFTVANRLTEGTEFGDEDVRLLETLANQAGVALENGQLEQSLAELSRLKEQLRYQAYHDPLTDMPNRVQFVETATTLIRTPHPLALRPVILLLDLDDFKNVNDTMGHAAGDELLVMVTERLRGCLREEDLAARLGGDEFAILINDGQTLNRSAALAERLIESLSEAFVVRGHDVVIGVSIGIAMSREPEQSASELLGNADVAMYTAKAAGRRRFAVFDPTMHAAIVARRELSTELARSIDRSELLVLHQPIVNLATLVPVGVEALVRWRHPTRGLVEPDTFIGLAEESGSILPLGRYVLETASRQAQRHLGPDLFVSVNVSAVQLQQANFLAEVERALAISELPGGRLVLEITESAMFRDTQATIDKLSALRRSGVRIAIDDFGTGYSSLTYLRRFPVDILKIARDFIGQPDEDSQEWAFTGAILALGRRLGLTVVAEGVENQGQLDRLREMGCELGQGYLFARPGRMDALFAAADERPGQAAAQRVQLGSD
ncbi:MAG TPA: GGDEF domain-containing protein [Candidatus Limnocylindria bacterium]